MFSNKFLKKFFNNPDLPITLNVNSNNVPLEQINSAKYFDTITDSILTWKEQIASADKKIAQGCHALLKLKPCSDTVLIY